MFTLPVYVSNKGPNAMTWFISELSQYTKNQQTTYMEYTVAN